MKPIELYMRVSDLRAWLDCRRRFYLQNVYGASEANSTAGVNPPGNADIGTLVDYGLNFLFEAKVRPSLSFAPNVPQNMPTDELAIEWSKAIDLADIMLDGFEEWWSEQPESAQLRTIGTQVEVSHRFGPFVVTPPGGIIPHHAYVTIVGHLDLEAHDHKYDCLSVNDFKTVATLMQGPRQIDWQLNMYALLLSKVRGKPVGSARHIQLRRVKRTSRANPPFYGIKELVLGELQHQRAELLLRNMISDILSLTPWLSETPEDNFYPSPSGECGWKCRVESICAMMDDDSDWESVAESGFNILDEVPITIRPTYQADKENAE